MENPKRLPSDLSNHIFSNELEVETGTLTQELLSETVQLYAEAVSFYTSIINQHHHLQGFKTETYTRRTRYYQQKIKKLMTRTDVQSCWTGKESCKRGADFKKELTVVGQHAPEQARALANHFGTNRILQDKLIDKALSRQKTDLSDRIKRRSKSKYYKYQKICLSQQETFPVLKKSLVYMDF